MGVPRRPLVELIRTIEPPSAPMCGTLALTVCHTPVRLMSSVRCQTCGDVVGVYEPIVFLEPGGRRETSIAAEPELRGSAPVCHHRACANELDDPYA